MNTLTKGFAKRALSALLATIMVFSLGIVGISTASAAEVELADSGLYHGANAYLYFIKPSGWSNVSMLIGYDGYSEMRTFAKLSGNLYYLKMVEWSGWTEWVIIDATGWESNNQLPSARIVNTSNKTDVNKSYEFGANNTYLIKNTTANSVWYENGYEGLDSVQYAYAQLSTDGGSTGTTNSAVGSVSISTKEMTGNVTVSNSTGTNQATAANGVTVSLTATAKTGYNFLGWYNSSGTRVSTSTSYSYTCSGSSTTYYARFENSFTLSVDASAAEGTVFAGSPIEITASSNGENEGATVTYTLKDADGNTVGEPNTDGFFEIDTTGFDADTYEYTVDASCTISGVNYTATSDVITVTVQKFDGLVITPVYPASVECGQNIDITVTANTGSEVTYVLKDADGNELATNTTGVFSQATSTEDKNTTKQFTIEATATVAGTDYTAAPVTINVDVVPISNTTTVTLYFKSTSTLGFAPIATVTGMYETLTDVSMEKAIYICSNETNTADYWWYKVTTKVSDTNPNISLNLKSSRYSMEVTAYLEVVEGVTEYYFGLDNLYYDDADNTIVDMTSWDALERNYCVNAVHMVYDAEYDTAEELEAFSAKCVMAANGDVNLDGSVNVKDATYLQKSLVNLAELGTTGEKVADLDDDGTNTIKDATAIQKSVAGL